MSVLKAEDRMATATGKHTNTHSSRLAWNQGGLANRGGNESITYVPRGKTTSQGPQEIPKSLFYLVCFCADFAFFTTHIANQIPRKTRLGNEVIGVKRPIYYVNCCCSDKPLEMATELGGRGNHRFTKAPTFWVEEAERRAVKRCRVCGQGQPSPTSTPACIPFPTQPNPTPTCSLHVASPQRSNAYRQP